MACSNAGRSEPAASATPHLAGISKPLGGEPTAFPDFAARLKFICHYDTRSHRSGGTAASRSASTPPTNCPKRDDSASLLCDAIEFELGVLWEDMAQPSER